MRKVQQKWQSLSNKTQNIAKLISAAIVIISSVGSFYAFINKAVRDIIISETSNLQIQISENQKRSEELEREILMATSRSEVMNLIQNYPDHIESIKKAAAYYFQTLHGDSYVHTIFYEWCNKYDVDACAIAINE